MKIQKFEELEIWKKSRLLCQTIRDLSQKSSLMKDFSLKDQILRSSGSVMDNIAEGFERDGRKEFIQFLYIAKGSLGETRSQIYRCFDAHHITEEQYNEVLNNCIVLSSQIKSFINYLTSTEYGGIKNRPQHL